MLLEAEICIGKFFTGRKKKGRKEGMRDGRNKERKNIIYRKR